MPLVHITGLPIEGDMVVTLRAYLNPKKLRFKYWIKEVTDNTSSNCKEVKIDFQTFDEAREAEVHINNTPYRTRKGRVYNLIAKISDPQYDESRRNQNDGYQFKSYNRKWPPEGGSGRYSTNSYSTNQVRSHSPVAEPSELDEELALLRKKILLIEEERKLIMEKKKLEMIKELGPNALAESEGSGQFNEEASALSADSSREFTTDQEARNNLLLPQWTGDRAHAPPPGQRALAHLPQFVLPCRIILSQMKKAIARRAPDLHERNLLKKMVSANLRRRFAILLENRPYTPSDTIAVLYRQVYPKSKDEELLDITLKDVKASHVPKRIKSQKTLQKMAIRKAAKQKFREILAQERAANVNPASGKKKSKAKKKKIKTEVETPAGDVKPVVADSPQVKVELNTSVAETPNPFGDDDWDMECDDWNDVTNK